MVPPVKKPSLAVWKFASCDGCQLSLLDMEDELLEIADSLEIAFFLEAGGRKEPGPYDLSLVEGSITTPEDAQRIYEIRKESKLLVAIGACATSGGIQALRNFADVSEYASMVYASPEYLSILKNSEPIKSYVDVDYELHGCPIGKKVLLEFIAALLNRKSPRLPSGAVCTECKAAGLPCVSVVAGQACLGPVTRSGCEALCISYGRPCYGCFGPKEAANVESLTRIYRDKNHTDEELIRLYRTFHAAAAPLAAESVKLKKGVS